MMILCCKTPSISIFCPTMILSISRRSRSRSISDLGQKMEKMLDKQDQMLDRQDETTGEVRGLRSDLKESLDVRLRRIEAGPRRECCRPWGRRAASDRFNAPPPSTPPEGSAGTSGTVDGSCCGRTPPWTDPAGRGAGAESTDIPRAFFFGSGSLRGLVLFRLVGPGLLMVVAGAL